MATLQKTPAKALPPVWKQLSNFANAHPLGIEKILRFIQAVSTILASSIFVSYIPNAVYVAKFASAKNQLALARRYLRFFKFIDCFDAGYAAWQIPAPLESDGVKKIANVGKWSFLGIYFFLEDLTLLNAMGVWETTWAQELFVECHKWWFFGILLSIMGSTVTIFFPDTKVKPSSATTSSSGDSKQVGKTGEKNGKTSEKQQSLPPKQDITPIVKRLIVDSCDILIPGSVLGWIQASPTQVGIAMIVSTLVASRDIWIQVNM